MQTVTQVKQYRVGHTKFNELFVKFARRAEILCLGGEGAFGLRVERGVFDEGVHKDEHVIAHLIWLHRCGLVLLIDDGNQLLRQRLGKMFYMGTSACGTYAVYKADLLEFP